MAVKVVQVRKSASYADFKKRVADCLTKLCDGAQTYKQDQLRLWLVEEDDGVLDGLRKTADAMQKAEDAEMCDDSEEVEVNSGVECPGNRSIEPYVGSQLTLEEKEFVNCCILVEVA